MESLLLPFIHVSALVGVLAYFLRQPVRDFVFGRHATLRDEVEGVRGQLRDARKSYDEYSAKLKAVSAEVAQLRDEARREGEAAKARIFNEAKRIAGTVVADAKAHAEQQVVALKQEVAVDLVNQVLSAAQAGIEKRLTGEEKARIRREFSSQMGRAS